MTYNDFENGSQIGEEITRKIIMPVARSYCRVEGSKTSGREFIAGDSRAEFETKFEDVIRAECEPLGIEVVQALIRNIQPPQQIAGPVRDRELAKQDQTKFRQQILQQQEEIATAIEREMVKRKQAIVKADQDVVKMTTEALREQEVAVTKANERLEVAKLKVQAAKDEAEAIRARGKAEADVITFNNEAEAAGWKQSVAAFSGDGNAFARYLLHQKLAPAYRNIMANTDNSPIMRILKPCAGQFRRSEPAEHPAGKHLGCFDGHHSVRGQWFIAAEFPNLSHTKVKPMATRFYAKKSFISTLVIVLIIAVGGWTFIEWTVNRIYVPEGYSLRLRYKGPPLPLLPGYGLPEARSGFAKVDENGRILEKGVLREMLGPGRHFRTPFYWERELVKDIEIAPGQIGIATSKLGKQLPGDQYLVDGDLGETEFKGVLRKVFGPGTYRVNDYAYTFTVVERTEIRDGDQVKYAGWVEIPAGFVGVVTNLASNELTGQQKGIQQKVLPPGIYPVNQKEQQIDVVEIGYRDRSIVANLKKDPQGNLVYDEAGEPMLNDTDSGIFFYSNDGFPISMDFTAIWGIMPEQAPNVISKFGNVAAVEQKVVVPQIESICRNIGAKFGAVELLVGDSRQQFQEDASTAFRTVLEGKDITLLNGLVRHIYIPQSVRLPIQQAFIADELALTREEEQKTLQIEADFREAEQMVELEQEKSALRLTNWLPSKLPKARKPFRRHSQRPRDWKLRSIGKFPCWTRKQPCRWARRKQIARSCRKKPEPANSSWPLRRSARERPTTPGCSPTDCRKKLS